MNSSQFLRLLFTAGVWGASHVFLRIIVPAFGPEIAVFLRVATAVLTLSVLLSLNRTLFPIRPHLKLFFRQFFAVGFLNMAFPFLAFAFAAQYLPATYLVILNATVPIFSASLSSIFMKEPFGWRRWASIFLGVSGVFLLTEYGSIVEITPHIAMGLAAGLVASLSYGMGSVYTRMNARHVPSAVLVWGSNLVSVAMLLPFAFYAFQTHGDFHSGLHSWLWVGFAVFMLGAFGSGIAFVVFYKLISEIGAFNASLSTFLMPMFGLVWGVLFLGETVTTGMICGAALVVGSAALFIKK